MRGILGLCLLGTGLSIGAYSHYPGVGDREATLVELTEIITGAVRAKASPGPGRHAASQRDQRYLPVQATDQQSIWSGAGGWFTNSEKLVAAIDDPQQRSGHGALGGTGTSGTDPQEALVIAALDKQLGHSATSDTLSEQPSLRATHTETVDHGQSGQKPLSYRSGWKTAVVQVGSPTAADEKYHLAPSDALKPKSASERARLIKNLQRELKRVGCYWGKIDGVWGKGSKRSLIDFIEAVNSTLPAKKPDYFQYKLVSSHRGSACGSAADKTQVASNQAGDVTTKTTARWQAVDAWRGKVERNTTGPVTTIARAPNLPAHTKPSLLRTGSIAPSGTTQRQRVASVDVGGQVNTPTSPAMTAQQRRAAPLPGRMSIGALDRDRKPLLVAPPKRLDRNAVSEDRKALQITPNKRVKVSALPNAGDSNEGATVDRRTAAPSPAAKRPARAAPKRAAKKKAKRRYRSRHRTRSVQAIFMHPLGFH